MHVQRGWVSLLIGGSLAVLMGFQVACVLSGRLNQGVQSFRANVVGDGGNPINCFHWLVENSTYKCLSHHCRSVHLPQDLGSMKSSYDVCSVFFKHFNLTALQFPVGLSHQPFLGGL